MLEIKLETDGSADFVQTIDLDNITTSIRLTYNTRVGYWFTTITTENYQLSDMKVIIDYPILYPHRAIFPVLPGDFFVQQVTNETESIDFNYENFGTIFKLFYYDADELAAWEAENGV